MNWGWGLTLGKHIVLERKQLLKRGKVEHFCISYLFLSLASARQNSSASICLNHLGEANRRDGYADRIKGQFVDRLWSSFSSAWKIGNRSFGAFLVQAL